ncbi:MAG: carbonic anhydrase [Bryobacteraceae bacterium]|nr:carbonic anhydrase [Bryobacteraceae bacterium]
MPGGQKPRALFITCSDSRIEPNMLMQSSPGDLFICRNAGNIVPAYGGASGGVSATIEYAVLGLGVPNIVICGHTDCGAMGAIQNPDKVKDMPTVRSWVRYAEVARRIVEENYPDLEGQELTHVLAQENVLAQLDNLRTHPSVAARMARGQLNLHGWIYHLHTAEVMAYDGETQHWVPLGPGEIPTAVPHPRLARKSPEEVPA